ncbi:MAG TPA: T9SS type A sorting domain-containing protein, partial [Bacteroidia bacterium]|nr:T9SS type A sorting domain-containing protein [Bacteroidia bacterium]
ILSVDNPLYDFYSCFFRNVVLLNFADTIPPLTPPNNFDRAANLESWATNFDSGSSTFTAFHAAGPLNQDFCIGIKFSINGQNHFGWIKVELLNRQAIIKEYAYQSQPNVPILACDTTNLATGISENNPQFNFSQQNNSIHISSFQNLNHANISVYDLLGKEILQQPFEGKETTVKIDKKGIYFVEIKSEKGISRKKIFIY